MIRGSWTITGSWPIATERPGRLRSQDAFFIRGAPWLDPFTPDEYGVSPVFSVEGQD